MSARTDDARELALPAENRHCPTSGEGLGLVQVGTSGDSAESLVNPPQSSESPQSPEQWERARQLDGLLQEWRLEKRDAFERIARRARELDKRAGGETEWATRAEWYEARARGLSVPWGERAGECGRERELAVTCNACGSVHVRPLACGLRHWCEPCALARSRREFSRLQRALDARVREQRVAWFRAGRERKRAPQLRLLTLTVRDGVDLEEARDVIAAGWKNLRRWLHEECGYAPAFSATWEVTGGTSRKGHPHLHICAVLPFIDVQRMADCWVRVTRGRAEGQGLDLTTVTPTGGAKYVSAYVTASALDEDLPAETAAAWTRASYGRRLVHASVRFWLPLEKRPCCDCGEHASQSVAVRQTNKHEPNKRSSRAPPSCIPPGQWLH